MKLAILDNSRNFTREVGRGAEPVTGAAEIYASKVTFFPKLRAVKTCCLPVGISHEQDAHSSSCVICKQSQTQAAALAFDVTGHLIIELMGAHKGRL